MLKKSIFGIFFLLIITQIKGQTDTSMNFLEQVVVTGTRTRHTLKNVPVLTKIVSKIELNEIGAVTALDALENLVPGLTFNPDANHGDNIQLQGLDNKYILILLNGERMVNGRAENVNFARLNISDILRIEIIDGAASVLYGSNAIGAVINIITQEVSNPVDIAVGGRYGSYNSYVADASVGLKWKKWSSKTSFNTKGTDGYQVKNSGRRAYPSDDYNLSQSFKFNFSEKVTADLYGSAYLGTVWPYKDINHRSEIDYNVGAKLNWLNSALNTLTFSVNTDSYNAYTYSNQTNEKLAYNNYHILSARVNDTWSPCSTLQVIGGYEYNYEYSYAPDRFSADSAIHSAYDNNFFLQGEIKLWDALTIVAGARLTLHSSFNLHLTPKLSLMYRLGDFRFRAGVSNGFKAPSLKEMYYSFDMPGGFYIKGNPNLRAETSWYESASIEYIAKNFNVSATFYNNDINDKIAMVEYNNVPGFTVPVLHYENVDHAYIRGIDVAARLNALKYFNFSVNYAFADTEDKATGLPLYGSSKHNFTGGIVFRYAVLKIGKQSLPFSLNLSGRLSSPRLYRNIDANGVITSNDSKSTSIWRAVYTQSIPQYLFTKNLECQIGVDNLFDWTDTSVSVNPGRTWFIALKIIF